MSVIGPELSMLLSMRFCINKRLVMPQRAPGIAGMHLLFGGTCTRTPSGTSMRPHVASASTQLDQLDSWAALSSAVRKDRHWLICQADRMRLRSGERSS